MSLYVRLCMQHFHKYTNVTNPMKEECSFLCLLYLFIIFSLFYFVLKYCVLHLKSKHTAERNGIYNNVHDLFFIMFNLVLLAHWLLGLLLNMLALFKEKKTMENRHNNTLFSNNNACELKII